MPNLVNILEKEIGVALSWLEKNRKFCSILLRKNQASTIGEKIYINGKIINSEETVKLLGVILNYKLDVDPHISNVCKKTAAELNGLKRLKGHSISSVTKKKSSLESMSWIFFRFSYVFQLVK